MLYNQASTLRHTAAISLYTAITYFVKQSSFHTEAHLGHIVIYCYYIFCYTIRFPHWGTPRSYRTYYDIQSDLNTEAQLRHIVHTLMYNQVSTLRHTLVISYILWYTIRPPYWGTTRPYCTYFDIQSDLHPKAQLGHIVHTLIYNQTFTLRHNSAISYILCYTIRLLHWGTRRPYRYILLLHTLLYNQVSTLRHTSAISLYTAITYFVIQSGFHTAAHLGHIVIYCYYIFCYAIRFPHWGTARSYCTYYDIQSDLNTEAQLNHIVHTMIYNQTFTLRLNSAILYILWYSFRPQP